MSAFKGESLGTVIVTGGSRGIGRATAMLLAGLGYHVALTFCNDRAAAESTADTIQSAGGRATPLRLRMPEDDVTDWFRQVDAFVESQLVGLVNNAACVPTRHHLIEADLDDWRLALDVNVLGLASLCREAIVRMAVSRGGAGGSIVNVSSQVASFGSPGLAGYAASKGAVNAFSLSLARECGPDGIRVNVVSPGLIVDADNARGNDHQRSQVAQIPLGRLGNPTDVGELIAWLISPKAAFVTGTIIPVHGGR